MVIYVTDLSDAFAPLSNSVFLSFYALGVWVRDWIRIRPTLQLPSFSGTRDTRIYPPTGKYIFFCLSESNTAAVVGNLPAIRQMRTECFPSPFSNDFLLCRSKWGEKETKIRCGGREKRGTKHVY